MAKLTVAEVQKKTTKGGKPYLNIKSSTEKWYYCWSDASYIWHLITVGATIEPVLATQGNFTSITGIMGVADASGGVTIATNRENAPQVNSGSLTGQGQTAWDRLFVRLDKLDEKIEWLVNERKTLGELPKLEDLPEHNLEDRNEIDAKKLDF